MEANQHILSHWGQALCCSSPSPCNSASRWQNSKTTPTADILPVLPAPHNTQVLGGAAAKPKPSAVSPAQAGAQGYSQEVTTASFKKLLNYGELSAWSETTQCFCTAEHTHCCCVSTAHFTVWHKSVQNWPLYQGGRIAQLPAWTQLRVGELVFTQSYKLQSSAYSPHTKKWVLHRAISHRWHLVFTFLPRIIMQNM